jgi:PAS domain S-box-containing protein
MARLRGIAETLFAEGYLEENDVDPLFSEETDRLLLIASAEGRCLRANDAWRVHLGYPKEAIEGTSYFDLVHPDDQPDTRKVADGMADERVTNFYNRYRTARGGYKWLSWAASQYDKAGTTYAVADIIDDADALLGLDDLARQRSQNAKG